MSDDVLNLATEGDESQAGVMGWLRRTFSGDGGKAKKETKVKAMAAAFESPKPQKPSSPQPPTHEVGELTQKFQSQINHSFEEAEKSHKSSTPSKAVTKIKEQEATRTKNEERSEIYVHVEEQPTTGDNFKRNVDKFRTAEEVAMIAEAFGNEGHETPKTTYNKDFGGDLGNGPTIAQIPGKGVVSKGRQAVMEREKTVKEAEEARKIEKKTGFVSVGSSGAEGKYKKTTVLVSQLGIAKKKEFGELP